MKLKQLCEAFDYKITEGSVYCWKCFGTSARFLDFRSDYAEVSVVFDSVNQEVYMASIDSIDSTHYMCQWVNGTFKDQYVAESVSRGIKPNQAYDSFEYTDLEVDEDFLEKATAIFHGEPFDKRVIIPLTLDDNTMLMLMTEAHKRDITLNKMVESLLIQVIEESENSKRE
jgi:hypothetical protein